MPVTAYLPAGTGVGGFAESDITTVEYETPAHLATLLAKNGGSSVVLLTGELSGDDQATVAAAIRGHAIAAIEVRLERWDGFSASPLSAVCQGVIAGFGTNGVPAAVAILRAS